MILATVITCPTRWAHYQRLRRNFAALNFGFPLRTFQTNERAGDTYANNNLNARAALAYAARHLPADGWLLYLEDDVVLAPELPALLPELVELGKRERVDCWYLCNRKNPIARQRRWPRLATLESQDGSKSRPALSSPSLPSDGGEGWGEEGRDCLEIPSPPRRGSLAFSSSANPAHGPEKDSIAPTDTPSAIPPLPGGEGRGEGKGGLRCQLSSIPFADHPTRRLLQPPVQGEEARSYLVVNELAEPVLGAHGLLIPHRHLAQMLAAHWADVSDQAMFAAIRHPDLRLWQVIKPVLVEHVGVVSTYAPDQSKLLEVNHAD